MVAGPRVLFYCHDSYGLGHVRRTLTLSRCLHERRPGASQLLVTGSPLAHRLVPEDDIEYVKLPSVLKCGQDDYRARLLPLDPNGITSLRSELIAAATRHFTPDVVVVDHAPAGMNGEILPPLEALRKSRPQTRFVLGLRDVVDDAERVREAWTRDGVYGLLDDLYDRILVYGEETVFDVVRGYAFPAGAARKTRYVGYLGRPPARPADQVRAELGLRTGRLVLVTAGGGGDGYTVLRTYLDALRYDPRAADGFDSLLVTGPLMPQEERKELEALVPGGLPVRVVDFVDDGMSTVTSADAVVSMGGYNSIAEIMSAARPAVVIPRIAPRTEQLIRAERLSRRGLIRLLHPDELSPRRLLDEVKGLLAGRVGPMWPVSLEGTTAAVQELEALLPDADAADAQELRLVEAR
jgi:predicted glycosyltransferase